MFQNALSKIACLELHQELKASHSVDVLVSTWIPVSTTQFPSPPGSCGETSCQKDKELIYTDELWRKIIVAISSQYLFETKLVVLV